MDTVLHTCPVCGAGHEVHPVLHRLAYDRQLTCSAHCKTIFPRVLLARMKAEAAERNRLAVLGEKIASHNVSMA